MKIVFIICSILAGYIFLSIIFHVAENWLIKFGFHKKIKVSYDFLDHEMQQYGRELEKLSYDQLKELTQQKQVIREIRGQKLKFWFCPELEDNGDLFVLIEVIADTWEIFNGTPTYTFWKRKDGTVYHGEAEE